MKDSVWEVDRVYGLGFRDPRDGKAKALFEMTDPVLSPLGRLLINHLKRAPGTAVRVETLREFALFETVYRREHVTRTLKIQGAPAQASRTQRVSHPRARGPDSPPVITQPIPDSDNPSSGPSSDSAEMNRSAAGTPAGGPPGPGVPRFQPRRPSTGCRASPACPPRAAA
jgi:hypothetical protein